MTKTILKPQTKNNKGFTLIELTLVIIIVAIMSSVFFPRFIGDSGFEENAYRTETISSLRAIQQIAMQNTATGQCRQVLITDKKLGQPDGCLGDEPPTFSDGWPDNRNKNTSVIISHNAVNYKVGASGLYFTFDTLGRPVLPLCERYPCPIDIIIQGNKALTIRIEAEGYIHGL